MLKRLSFFILFLVLSMFSYGQAFFYDDKYYDADILWEGGISFGLMNGITDVSENKGKGFSPGYYHLNASKSNFSAHFGILYKGTFEGRIQLTKGTIAGDDANSNSAYVRSRNLNYKSKIFEAAFVGAFHPLMLRNTETLPLLSPYVMAGLGIFSFFPQTLYEGQWVPLRRMNTEGQTSEEYPARKQYSLRALSIPLGIGVKYEYNAKFNLRLEALGRFTTSDYLDDVSTTYVDRAIFPTETQKLLSHRYEELDPNVDRTGWARGNSNNKDKFFTINLSVGYVLGRKKIPINYNPDNK
ncbi:MAG: hypothetical protein JWR18_3153 [Segetibacter sp.]|jgi:hypothetical protein|nr:hypothetical protein [Segetibacter sp.]